MKTILCCSVALLLGACASTDQVSSPGWAIVIHGGAGVISKDMPLDRREAYVQGLERALQSGRESLQNGGSALETVELVIRQLEDDPHFNAGRGAVYTAEGKHELDASIMDGQTLGCGAVTGVRTIRHPISLARKVMERSPHVFFSGDGAEKFADQVGVERVANTWFDTERRRQALDRALKKQAAPKSRGTVGAVVLDSRGNLAAGTSTGGMTAKRFGRIGDSPVIGAGNYANNRSCAVSCTGTGEEFIRHTVARDIAALVEYRGMTLEEACREVVHHKLAPGDGGVIAVSHRGEVALVYSSRGMFRGVATAKGRFEVAIWDDVIR